MTLRPLVPSQIEAERLADLIEDVRAIPAAAFSRSTSGVRRAIDLTVIPVQRAVVQIPAASVSLVEAADHHFISYSR
jgi:hypothetical protein